MPSTILSSIRTPLATALGSVSANVYSYVPEAVQVPAVILVPSGDWVTAGDTFGAFRIGFDVTLIVENAANETMITALDDLVDDTLDAIAPANGFYASQVGAPSLIEISGANYLSTTITVYQYTKL